MNEKLRFKTCYRVETILPDQAFLFSEKECLLLRGKSYVLLAPFLQEGKYTDDEMADLLEKQAPLEEIYYTLERLKKKGYIENYNPSFASSFSALCHLLGVSPEEANLKLQKSCLYISGSKEHEEKLSPLFSALGIQIVKTPENANIGLTLVEDYLDPSLKTWDHKQVPWLLVKPTGLIPWIGPLFNPPETGCLHCLATRLRRNQVEHSFIKRSKSIDAPFVTSFGFSEATLGAALHYAAVEIFKWIASSDKCNVRGKLLSFNLETSQIEEHTLIPDPFCPHCGEQPLEKNFMLPLKLEGHKKTGNDDGGYRCLSPENTVRKYAHHVSPILGTISNLILDKPSEDSSICVYRGGHNFALTNEVSGLTPLGFRSSSGGKGKTEMQAKASCVCETLERYSGIFQGNEMRKKSSFRALKTEAIHPHSCLLISEEQYAKVKTSPLSFEKNVILNPFDEEKEIEWSPLWSLTEQRYKYLPTAYCYYGYPINKKEDFCAACSNGCAAGNVLEEAILQGFFELVERDSIALWWYNRVQRPSVDLNSFDDPYIQSLIAEYRVSDREVWVLDLTTDLNIPSFVALSRRTDRKKEDILMGFGCHFDSKIAVLRALAEMNQMIFVCSGMEEVAKERPLVGEEKIISDWLNTATLKNQPYLAGKNIKTAKDYSFQGTDDLYEDILYCQKIVEQLGMEMLVLDQTRVDIGLKVVKVVIPGLRHFWPRFAPGRLYTTPVKLGWLQEEKKESELNPIAMFL